MAEKPQSAPQSPPVAPSNSPATPRRGSAFRGGDAKDPMVELTERAKLISQEAGTKVSSAMRDMISAAAGIAGFAVESARDLVQYMVRRGQMTQEEADKLIREAEASHMKRPAAERAKLTASKIAAEKAAAAKKAAMAAANMAPPPHRPLVPGRMVAAVSPRVSSSAASAPSKGAAPASKPAVKAAAAKPLAKVPEKPAMKAAKPAKPAPKAAAKAPAKKPAKPAKPAAKAPGKKPEKKKRR